MKYQNLRVCICSLHLTAPLLFIVFMIVGCKSFFDLFPKAPSDSINSAELQLSTDLAPFIFPQDSCGDELPNDRSLYPITFHSVLIEYSEDNLARIQSSFCRDAFIKNGESLIQIASFSDTNRAEQFSQILIREFGTSSVMQSVVVESPPTLKSSQISNQSENSTESSPEQSFGLQETHKSLLRNLIADETVILPAYLPQGFDNVELHTNGEEFTYLIKYMNSKTDECFAMGVGAIPAAPLSDSADIIVSTKIFGGLGMTYWEFDRSNDNYYIDEVVRFSKTPKFEYGHFAFLFASPADNIHPFHNGPEFEPCAPISRSEAKKVMESIDFFVPPKGDFSYREDAS